MKKLFLIGAVCMAGLASCKSATCPAYSKADSAKSHPSEIVKANTATDKDRS